MVRSSSVLDRITENIGDRRPAVHWPSLSQPFVLDAVEAAEGIRKSLLGELRRDQPLLDLGPVVTAAGAELVQRDLGAATDGCEALLLPLVSGGFRIVVDPTPRTGWTSVCASLRNEVARHRLRFRVGHELAHTFFYERLKSGAPRRCFPGSAAEERFCDSFAEALLLPRAAVARCQSVEDVLALQQQYDVSLELAARAFAGVTKQSVALFYWAHETTRAEVQWSNLAAKSRRLQWRRSISATLKGGRELLVDRGRAVVIPDRNQALVLAT